MPLPASWVERIFQKLSLVYGRDFIGRWEGQEMAAVMTDWGHELDGWQNQPEAIKHALSHLPPDKPPTVLQFRALCNGRPEPEAKKLPPPESKPSPEVLEAAASLAKAQKQIDPRQWARDLQDRELKHGGELWNGRMMTRAQREMWRDALRVTA